MNKYVYDENGRLIRPSSPPRSATACWMSTALPVVALTGATLTEWTALGWFRWFLIGVLVFGFQMTWLIYTSIER